MRAILLAVLFLLLLSTPVWAGLAGDDEVTRSAPPVVTTHVPSPDFEVVPAGRPRNGSGGGVVGAVPEPSAFLAFASGALIVAASIRRRRTLG